MPDIFNAADARKGKKDKTIDVDDVVEETTEPAVTEEIEEAYTDENAEPIVAAAEAQETARELDGEAEFEPPHAETPDSEPQKKVMRHVDEYSQVMRQEPPAHSHLQAFAPKPDGMSFDTQHGDEQILLLLRQHPVTQVKWFLTALLLIFLPFLFSYVGFLYFLPVRFHVAAAIGWYLMVIGFSLQAFLSWFFNVYIITDERVIDIDFHSLLYRDISYAKIDKIEDLTATTSGSLGAVFDYGTVKIQTAAAIAEFDFEDVPHPTRVTAFLNEMMLEEEREKLEGRVS